MKKRKSHNSKQMKAASWVAASVFIAGLAVLAGLYLEQNTRITGVEFTGNYFTAEETLGETIQSPVGMLADSVNYREIFRSLKSLPYVENVNLSMGMRGKLSFEIEERSPLALLTDGSKRVYIAEGGIKLPVIPEKTEDVPILYGFPAEPLADALKSEEYGQVEAFLTEARKNDFGWTSISEIAWSNREGVTALSHENGVKLVFGENNFSEKLQNWQAFYREIITKNGIHSFQHVDFRFRDQIVTRKS